MPEVIMQNTFTSHVILPNVIIQNAIISNVNMSSVIMLTERHNGCHDAESPYDECHGTRGRSMRLCHPPDDSTSPKYKLLCFKPT